MCESNIANNSIFHHVCQNRMTWKYPLPPRTEDIVKTIFGFDRDLTDNEFSIRLTERLKLRNSYLLTLCPE